MDVDARKQALAGNCSPGQCGFAMEAFQSQFYGCRGGLRWHCSPWREVASCCPQSQTPGCPYHQDSLERFEIRGTLSCLSAPGVRPRSGACGIAHFMSQSEAVATDMRSRAMG